MIQAAAMMKLHCAPQPLARRPLLALVFLTLGPLALMSLPRQAWGQGSWIPISQDNAPQARAFHTAVWTGQEMIVWGGFSVTVMFPVIIGPYPVNTGGRYDPATDTWRAIQVSDAPNPRWLHTAVWTGQQMIVWGGATGFTNGPPPVTNTGGSYDPATDTWTPISMDGAPSARWQHTAVWTGTEMLIWGGVTMTGAVNTGARYNRETDQWTPMSTEGAPEPLAAHVAVWTGDHMIVWGAARSQGSDPPIVSTGGMYDPVSDTWSPLTPRDAPSPRIFATAIWTGAEMIVWGGRGVPVGPDLPVPVFNTGGRYRPLTDEWLPTSLTLAPTPRNFHVSVWTGREMLIWGGEMDEFSVDTGGRYDPQSDTWRPIPTAGAPERRSFLPAVWTGSEMIIWGGFQNSGVGPLNSGARYQP